MRTKPESRDLLELTVGFAVAILLPLSVGTGRIGFRGAAAIFLISALTILLGRALRVILRIPPKLGVIFAFEIVVGFAALSLLQLGATALCNLTAGSALVVSAFVSILLFIFREPLAGRRGVGAPAAFVGNNCGEIGILWLLSLLTALWSREALGALRQAEKSGVFSAWEDFFAHATQIAYVRDYPAFGRQNLYLSDTPQLFYHRGSYALSSLFSRLSGETALQTALCFWLPVGLILMGVAAYGLGCALAGRTAGSIAALGLLLVPDASTYGLHNGFFSFYWLLEIAPASGYGIALVLAALATFVLGVTEARFHLVLLSVVLAALSALFKVHVAMLAVPLFLLLALASWRPAHRRRYVAVLFAVGAATLLGSIILFEHIPLAPHFLSGLHESLRFFSFAYAQQPPASAGFYARQMANSGPLMKNILGAVLLLPAAFGAILPALLLVAILRRRRQWAWQIESIPFALIGLYLVAIFLLPTPANGDFSEFSQRPFVFVYAVLVTMLAAMLVLLLRGLPPLGLWWRRGALLVGSFFAAEALAFDWKASARTQQSTLAWGPDHAETPIPLGLLAAARAIRENARPGDRVLSSDGDPVGLVIALTERQAFLSHAALFRSLQIPQAGVAAQRGSLLAALKEMRRYEDLAHFCREHRIGWFLLEPGDFPGWPPSLLDQSRWQFGQTRVFDLTDVKN